MKRSGLVRPGVLALVLATTGFGVTHRASANPVTVTFSNYTGLGFGVGTTQTLTNIDPLQEFQMTVLQGNYEITNANELNLKNQTSTRYTRSVEFTLKNGGAFDFNSFVENDGFPNALFTSNNGGSQSVPGVFIPTTFFFSGPQWQDITELTITQTALGEFKIPSLTFNDTPTIPTPEPASLALMILPFVGLLGYQVRRNRT